MSTTLIMPEVAGMNPTANVAVLADRLAEAEAIHEIRKARAAGEPTFRHEDELNESAALVHRVQELLDVHRYVSA